MEYTGETYKCKNCNQIWAYEDDACPDCGSDNFVEIEINITQEKICNHRWVMNYERGTKYCSVSCNGFKEVKI